jgi:hypothetical protein
MIHGSFSVEQTLMDTVNAPVSASASGSSDRRQPMRLRTARHRVWVTTGVALLTVAATSCTDSAGPPSLGANANGPLTSDSTTAQVTKTATVTKFVTALVEQKPNEAFAFLSTSDQQRYGSADRFAAELAGQPAWLAATVDAFGVATVTREPVLDPVFGLVPETARVTMAVATEPTSTPGASTSKVSWSRRTETSIEGAPESGIAEEVRNWVGARQRCENTPSQETVNGLVGVVGLATALCETTGDAVLGDTVDLLATNDPAPVLDAYGNDAARWARVVPLTSPVAMNVVVAPLGGTWKVIATTRVAS